MEIYANVHCIKAGYVNIFMFLDEDGWTLVDTGTPGKEKLVYGTLAQLGHKPKDIKRIIITHADNDHAGSLAAIQAESGAVVITSKESKPYLLAGKSPPHLPKPLQFVVNTFMKYEPISQEVIQLVADGDVLPSLGGLHVIESKGHTPDHCAYYSPSTGVLFAGDALDTRNGRVGFPPMLVTGDKELAAQAALKLLDLVPTTLACGHGEPTSDFSIEEARRFFRKQSKEAAFA